MFFYDLQWTKTFVFSCIFKIAYTFSLLILLHFSVLSDIPISLLAWHKQYQTLNTFYLHFQRNVAKSCLFCFTHFRILCLPGMHDVSMRCMKKKKKRKKKRKKKKKKKEKKKKKKKRRKKKKEDVSGYRVWYSSLKKEP